MQHQRLPALPERMAQDTPKSRRTRARILDAAMRLFAEIGYHAATNAKVSEAANLTRGAMLYHFAGRAELTAAAVGHIQAARMAGLAGAARQVVSGAEPAAHAIDVYRELLVTAPFVAFAELEAVARTDSALRALISPAQAEFDHASIGGYSPAQLPAGSGARLQTGQDLARFLLEGLARATLTFEESDRAERLVAVVKRATTMLNRKEVADLWPE